MLSAIMDKLVNSHLPFPFFLFSKTLLQLGVHLLIS